MRRMERVNQLLKKELADLISQKLTIEKGLITIAYVKCSPNLLNATIGISILPENLAGTALTALRRHNSEFSRILQKKLFLKRIPKFNWKVDNQLKKAVTIDKIIKKLKSQGEL